MAMKKAHKEMVKGGLVATAILVFQQDWYASIARMFGRNA